MESCRLQEERSEEEHLEEDQCGQEGPRRCKAHENKNEANKTRGERKHGDGGGSGTPTLRTVDTVKLYRTPDVATSKSDVPVEYAIEGETREEQNTRVQLRVPRVESHGRGRRAE